MFTGIIEEIGRVSLAKEGVLIINAREILSGLKLGESVSVNGACLTVAHLTADSFSVSIMPETLRRTALGCLTPGSGVNLERSLSWGGRMGGHLVQGHVDDTGKVIGVNRVSGAMVVKFEATPEIMRYVVEKGFIAIDGASLTVTDVDRHSFQVSLVEFTQKHTTLGRLQVGSWVNLEVDIIAKYVEKLSRLPEKEGLSLDFLKEHGLAS